MMNIKKTSRFWQMKNLLLASLSLCVLAVGHPAYASMGMTSESGTAAAADMPAALLTASAPDSVLPANYKVEQPARYPKGETALLQFLAENIRYPADALEKNIRGSVVIGFTVDKTGNVTDVKVLKPLHPSCDAEAVRVVKMLKKFKPAKTGGKEVAIRMVLPIRFLSK